MGSPRSTSLVRPLPALASHTLTPPHLHRPLRTRPSWSLRHHSKDPLHRPLRHRSPPPLALIPFHDLFLARRRLVMSHPRTRRIDGTRGRERVRERAGCRVRRVTSLKRPVGSSLSNVHMPRRTPSPSFCSILFFSGSGSILPCR